MGSSRGASYAQPQKIEASAPIYATSNGTAADSSSITSAVARSISTGAEAQVQAQNQARQRSSGIISTFKRYAGANAAATTDTKNKLGQ